MVLFFVKLHLLTFEKDIIEENENVFASSTHDVL